MRSWNLLFATRVTVAEALSWGSKVVPLDANGDPLPPSALADIHDEVSPLAGVLVIDAETYAKLAEIKRRHHNRVSTLQRRVRRARIARDRFERHLTQSRITNAQLVANEQELAATLRRVSAERDALQAAADERNELAVKAVADDTPRRKTKVVHLFATRADDVFSATGLPVGSLWHRVHPNDTWLHHPEGIGWQEGYQPVPFEPDGEHLVRIFERPAGEGGSPLHSKDEAEAQGFTVDTTCYPWVGYKGPRFSPSVCIDVATPAVQGSAA